MSDNENIERLKAAIESVECQISELQRHKLELERSLWDEVEKQGRPRVCLGYMCDYKG